MSEHEQFGEDLALYALGALEGPERAALELHLAKCASCKLELEQLRGDGALLGLSTVGPKPPLRARQRLLDVVAKEVNLPAVSQTQREEGATSFVVGPRIHVRDIPRRSWWGVLGWASAFAVLVFALSLWRENSLLRQTLVSASAKASQSAQELEYLRKVSAPILAPEAQHIPLVWTALKLPPSPQGKALYLSNRGSLVFLASNLPPLPSEKAYELWLIPKQGAPIPAGVFRPDVHGSASVVTPPLTAGTEAKAFAITIENAAGASSPTMPIVMMGAGE
jgi:hypothetical protein